jgi:hypothetical protein
MSISQICYPNLFGIVRPLRAIYDVEQGTFSF